MALLQIRDYLSFADIFPGSATKQLFIVTFLAVLELVKLKQITARQNRPFGEIRIYKVDNSQIQNEQLQQTELKNEGQN